MGLSHWLKQQKVTDCTMCVAQFPYGFGCLVASSFEGSCCVSVVAVSRGRHPQNAMHVKCMLGHAHVPCIHAGRIDRLPTLVTGNSKSNLGRV